MTAGSAPRRAFVIGGGVAGLTAAFGMADAGFATTLLESRHWLGGRAFSSDDRVLGRRLDNGPHVMLGCYRATRQLLRRLGTESGFDQQARLTIAYRHFGGAVQRLRLSRLPVPLAMPAALLRLRIPFGSRWRALCGMGATLLPILPGWTLDEWFGRRRQHGLPAAMLWRPLCRAIMNCEPEHASAHDFIATLREAFAGRASRAAFWIPLRPWSELIGDPAPAALARAGVTLRIGARVSAWQRSAAASDAPLQQLLLADGTAVDVGADDVVVAAMPWYALAQLMAPQDARAPAAAVVGHTSGSDGTNTGADGADGPGGASGADSEPVDASVLAAPGDGSARPDAPAFAQLHDSPIVSAYVTLPVGATPLPDDGPVVTLVGGEPFHFVLRRPGDEPRHLALLSGGDRSFDGQPVDVIAQRALTQLAAFYPGANLARAEVRIRKEQLATFIAAPGTANLRPKPGPLPGGPRNLRVCGDWTATGLPATLEGAARSALTMLREFTR